MPEAEASQAAPAPDGPPVRYRLVYRPHPVPWQTMTFDTEAERQAAVARWAHDFELAEDLPPPPTAGAGD